MILTFLIFISGSFHIQMILLIFSCLIFIALLLTTFIKIPQKLIVVSACVCLLIIVNFINEIQADNEPKGKIFDLPRDQAKIQINKVEQLSYEHWKANNEEYIWNELLEEEKTYANMLIRSWQDREFSLFYFEGLPSARLKLIIDLLISRVNSTSKLNQFELFKIDFQRQKCNSFCLQSSFKGVEPHKYPLLIALNIDDPQDLSNVRDIYFDINLTVIFEQPKQSFKFNSMSRIVQHHVFSNNYISKFVGVYSSKVIEHCHSRRSFDYEFYTASHITPLEELCAREAPMNRIDRCIRKLTSDKNEAIPWGWARKCYAEAPGETVQERNGWIFPKKISLNQTKVEDGLDL